jgi:hypothetical protein
MSDPTDLFTRTRARARPDPPSAAEAERLDAHWVELHERHGEGEPLSAEEAAFLAEHVAVDPEVRAEQAIFAALAREPHDDAEAGDDAVIARVLGRFEAERPAPVVVPLRSRVPIVAAISVLAAAGLAALWWWPRAPAPEEAAPIARTEPSLPKTTPAAKTADGGVTATDPIAPASARGLARVRSGFFVDAGGISRRPEVELADGTVTAPVPACFDVDDTGACVSADAELRLAHVGGGIAVTVARGSIDVRAAVMATTFVVQVAGDRVESPAVSRYVIEVHSADRWEISVVEGRVRVIDDDGTTTELGLGESRTFVEHARADLTPSQWVAQARARRNAGDAKGAIAAYEQLIERHPTSAAARTAMVSLGQLHLDLDEPRPALKWFDRYLAKPGGPLAEDAAYGRIRALGALGRTKAEREAVEAFLSSYPASSYAAKLRDR